MSTTVKTLYDTDFVEWTSRTAELLRAGRLEEVDLEHVAEEIEDLGRSERRAIRSPLRRLLVHALKTRIQSERAGRSWKGSIVSAQKEIRDQLRDAPSLRRHLEESLPEIYRDAIEVALAETHLRTGRQAPDIPAECPYSLAELLEGNPGDLV